MPDATDTRGKEAVSLVGSKLGSKLQVDESEEHDYTRWYFGYFSLACFTSMMADLNFTLLVSFFPKSVESKGLKSSKVGMIFAIYQLANFITSFFVPAITRKQGARPVMIVACSCQAVFVALMAFTENIDSTTPFFIVCMLLRCLQGMAAAFSEIACGGICMRCAPSDKPAEASTYMDMFRLIGATTGPFVGGLMFSSGGFKAPFLLSAGCQGIVALLYCFPMPKVINNKTDQDDDGREKSALKKMSRLPVIYFIFINLLFCCIGITFLEPTIEKFLSKAPYNLGHIQVGGMVALITISFIFFGCASPMFVDVLGKLPVLTIGSGLVGIGYFILAPAYQLKGPLSINSFLYQSSYKGAMALFISGLCLMGSGCGLIIIPVNTLLLSETELVGIPLKDSADAVVTVLNQAFTLGGFIGTSANGYLVQNLGFRQTCTLFGFMITTVVGISMIILFSIFKKRERSQTEDLATSSDSELAEPFLNEL